MCLRICDKLHDLTNLLLKTSLLRLKKFCSLCFFNMDTLSIAENQEILHLLQNTQRKSNVIVPLTLAPFHWTPLDDQLNRFCLRWVHLKNNIECQWFEWSLKRFSHINKRYCLDYNTATINFDEETVEKISVHTKFNLVRLYLPGKGSPGFSFSIFLYHLEIFSNDSMFVISYTKTIDFTFFN